ncbi:lipase [Legionella beliardensis]|uniref:Lipase n=1 Tax=Legionella beliardensis TaxID=91822 RepID=A0A378HYM6_9GAMM|nr:alpha/beta fold hydrolase [Legionella beliardensis]STX27580.1 lipase [Legionella beliardensis]
MKREDFRCINMGTQLATLSAHDASIIEPVQLTNGKKGNALLLLHGFSSTPGVFRFLLPHIIDYYDNLIIPALPGHAESIEAFSRINTLTLLNFAEQACTSLTEQYKNVDVLGLSLGGLLACYLSSKFKLRHLYLLAPALDLTLNMTKIAKIIQVLSAVGFNKVRSTAGNIYYTPEQQAAYRKIPLKTGFSLVDFKGGEIAYRQIPFTAILEILNLIRQFQFNIPTCPTDVFLGIHDKVVDSKQVAKRFSNHANINIHWLANSAHVLPLDNDIEVIIQCIQKNVSQKVAHVKN